MRFAGISEHSITELLQSHKCTKIFSRYFRDVVSSSYGTIFIRLKTYISYTVGYMVLTCSGTYTVCELHSLQVMRVGSYLSLMMAIL